MMTKDEFQKKYGNWNRPFGEVPYEIDLAKPKNLEDAIKRNNLAAAFEFLSKGANPNDYESIPLKRNSQGIYLWRSFGAIAFHQSNLDMLRLLKDFGFDPKNIRHTIDRRQKEVRMILSENPYWCKDMGLSSVDEIMTKGLHPLEYRRLIKLVYGRDEATMVERFDNDQLYRATCEFLSNSSSLAGNAARLTDTIFYFASEECHFVKGRALRGYNGRIHYPLFEEEYAGAVNWEWLLRREMGLSQKWHNGVPGSAGEARYIQRCREQELKVNDYFKSKGKDPLFPQYVEDGGDLKNPAGEPKDRGITPVGKLVYKEDTYLKSLIRNKFKNEWEELAFTLCDKMRLATVGARDFLSKIHAYDAEMQASNSGWNWSEADVAKIPSYTLCLSQADFLTRCETLRGGDTRWQRVLKNAFRRHKGVKWEGTELNEKDVRAKPSPEVEEKHESVETMPEEVAQKAAPPSEVPEKVSPPEAPKKHESVETKHKPQPKSPKNDYSELIFNLELKDADKRDKILSQALLYESIKMPAENNWCWDAVDASRVPQFIDVSREEFLNLLTDDKIRRQWQEIFDKRNINRHWIRRQWAKPLFNKKD